MEKIMTTKEKIEVMQAFVDGKPIESRSKYRETWQINISPTWNWLEIEFRIAPPALIPIERLRELCGGHEPHRSDWTTDMLPDGWRPLWLGETMIKREDVRLYGDGNFGTVPCTRMVEPDECNTRTRRPAPPLVEERYTVAEIGEWFRGKNHTSLFAAAFEQLMCDPKDGIAAVVARKESK